MRNQGLIEKLGEYFKKFDEVLCVYLFQSLALHEGTPSSSATAAVLLGEHFPEDRYSDFRLSRINELPRLFHKQIDVVIFNAAPTMLAYQILRNGARIYEKDDRVDHNLEVKTLMEYFDFLPYYKCCEEAMIKRRREAS